MQNTSLLETHGSHGTSGNRRRTLNSDAVVTSEATKEQSNSGSGAPPGRGHFGAGAQRSSASKKRKKARPAFAESRRDPRAPATC